MRYSNLPAATILIGSSSYSHCNNCGKDADPHAATHEDVAGYQSEPGGGCKIRYEYVYSTYFGDDAERAAKGMRPDLKLIPTGTRLAG